MQIRKPILAMLDRGRGLILYPRPKTGLSDPFWRVFDLFVSEDLNNLEMSLHTFQDTDVAFWSLKVFSQQFQQLIICLPFYRWTCHPHQEGSVFLPNYLVFSGIWLHFHTDFHDKMILSNRASATICRIANKWLLPITLVDTNEGV